MPATGLEPEEEFWNCALPSRNAESKHLKGLQIHGSISRCPWCDLARESSSYKCPDAQKGEFLLHTCWGPSPYSISIIGN